MSRERSSLEWDGFQRSIRLDSSQRRFALAVCASVLLHWIVLDAYDPRAPIPFGLLAPASWRALDATLRLPASILEAPAEDRAERARPPTRPALRGQTPAGSVSAEGAPGADAARSAIPAAPESVDKDAAAATAPRIDIDAAHRLARQLARAESTHRAAQPNPPLPRPGTRETKLSQAIAASVRPDCRTAYAGAGLFAIPALIVDAVTDRGCKW